MSRKPIALALIAVAATLAFVAPWGRAQTIAPTTSTPLVRNWPPHPESMYYWHGDPTQSIPANSDYVLLTVPPDRWFVLTMNPPLSSVVTIWQRTASGDVVLITDNSDAVLATNYSKAPLGIPFPPGSELVLKNTDSSSFSLQHYQFMGYFTRR